MAKADAGIGNVVANAELLQMAMAYSRSRVLCAAARLNIADALGDEERGVEELAASCEADADALYRLMRALAAMGVTQETAPRRFRLTGFGRPLRKDVPDTIWPAVIFWADLLADSWSLLTDCVRAGRSSWQVRDPNVPSRWSQEPDASAIFRAVMGTAPSEEYAPIVRAWDFSRAKLVADLGGGGGSLLLAVLELYPQIEGMLVDLEPSIEAARARFAALDPKLASRCRLVAADLSESVPAGADVYMLKHVLHGRTDAEAIAILKNCRAAMSENGTLLIIEFVLPEVVAGRDPQLELRLMSDLNMMVVTGGRERSEPEWRRLIEAAGLRLTRVYPVGTGVGIVEARPIS